MEDETVEVDEHFEEAADSPPKPNKKSKAANAIENARAVVIAGGGAVVVGAVGMAAAREHAQNAQNGQNGQNFTQGACARARVLGVKAMDGGSPEEDGFGQPQPRQEGASAEGETRGDSVDVVVVAGAAARQATQWRGAVAVRPKNGADRS